jgi:L-seryl-tRNA(Ser) seleniumtransferase
LVELGRAHDLLVYEDLGSGTLLDTAKYGFTHEPTVQEAVVAGLDLISFSGDKLLGAPQAGILVGRKGVVARLREFPLTRALRVDKTTLAGLQTTLLHYLREDAEQAIPVWRMLSTPLTEIDRRASEWVGAMCGAGVAACVVDGVSAAGGGSLPGETVPTRLAALSVDSPDRLAAQLRGGTPPVIARIENDLLCLDPRTVLPHQDRTLVAAVLLCLGLGEAKEG